MINTIKKALENNENVDEYKIIEKIIKSNELFLVKKNVDMDRAKNVHHFEVVVYKDIEEAGEKYKGATSIKIHPTMTEDEVSIAINEAIFAAQFAKNQYYPLVKSGQVYEKIADSNFEGKDLSYWISEITKSVYKNDVFEDGGINSCEIFLDKVYTHVVNSKGVDVEYENYKGMLEFISTWMGENEEVELYSALRFSEFDKDIIEDDVKSMINICRERAIASTTPHLEKVPVILTKDAVSKFFDFYYANSNAASVYHNQSTWKLNDNVQGNDIVGDSITMKVDPFMKNSIYSAPFDKDGFPLKSTVILEEGVLKNYIADTRFSSYLNVPTTGEIDNIVVNGGSRSIDELKKEPYFEVGAFSDFTVDELTGDFGGEIRLAWYFDGNKTIPVTGGSISGNINEVQRELYFSKEIQKNNRFEGPKAIKIVKVAIAGV